MLSLVALAALGGCFAQLTQARCWSGPWAQAGMLLGAWLWAVALWAWRRWRSGGAQALAVLCMVVGTALLAWGQTEVRAIARLQAVLQPELEGQELLLVGKVVDMPQVTADGVQFVFEVEQAQDLAAPSAVVQVPQRLWLTWRRGWQEDALLAGPPEALQAGERWQLPVRLKRPHGVMNPGGFDAELWLFERQLGAVGAVRAPSALPARLLATASLWDAPIEQARQALRDRVLLAVPDAQAAAVLAALSVGDQAAIEGPQWEVFRRTGIAHLISISGLHITLFAWMASRAVGWGWRRSARLCLWWPAPLAARWGGVLLAVGYALLAGWGVPAQRTVGMLALGAGLKSLGVNWPGWLLALWVAVGVVMCDPWALLAPGFWLSFGAVCLLMLSSPEPPPLAEAEASPEPPLGWAQRLRRSMAQAWHTQWVASLGLAPLSLILFNQVSLVGFVANLFAVPWVTLVVTPLALLGMLWSGFWCLAAWAVAPLLWALGHLAQWGGAGWVAADAPWWAVGLGLIGALGVVWPGHWPRRVLAGLLMLPLLMPPLNKPEPGQFELLALDVGQGSAVLVRTAHHALLHDTGPKFARDADAGQRIVLPLLRAQGIRQLDELILSHRDTDHVGGADAVLEGLPVLQMRSSLEPSHGLRRKAARHLPCEAGQHWLWDGVRFEVLHPQPGPPAPLARPNTVSCVLKVTDAQGRSALLTGDIEAEQEALLLAHSAHLLPAEVLVVPHHGSQTSSTAAFLQAVRPRVAIIQVAYRSRFGHPHPAVLARYAQAGIPVVRSDHCGAWVWGAEGGACTRVVRQRYWHWQAQP
ncbi:DNA internalization-related competence protein ComEC/Rec2 [Ideonella paludis]|uniref:DNA internalization-related competence protein ComEC/Rec2 n=1 Tax=Ideonella paludis TaxID=1233411 RepID=A0ABS5E0N7_9BURK|nr:DNA internalization-related competence protein ComEC/Rec2 [Ideonella paludis]MBQ0936952.1 DNA internalization-related competence protein ComEC/Rec2 [Ideonella paludis]